MKFKWLVIGLLLFALTAQTIPAQSNIVGSIRYLGRRASDAAAGNCNSARRGWIYYNTTSNLIRVCNGSAWGNIGAAGGSGILDLNGLTADPQAFATGTSGTDFNISSVTATHTFNIPSSSAANRGLLTSSDWSAFNAKPTISSGAGAPGSTPSKVGDIYIDTTGDNAYMAVGTASSADWKQIDGAGGGGTPGGSTTQVQFNSSGSFAGDAGFVWDNTNKILTLQNGANANVLRLNSTDANYAPGISFGFNSTNDNGPAIRPDFGGRLILAAPASQVIWLGGLQGVDGKFVVQGYAFETGGTATQINTRDAGTVGMTVKLATSQTANAFEVEPQSSTTPLMTINSAGNVTAPKVNATTSVGIPRVTAFPGSPAAGDTVIVTDDSAAGACDSGAGSAQSLCQYNGSGWVSLGDGSGSASAAGSDTQLQRNNAGSFGGISGATSDGTNVTFGSTNLRATRPRFTTSIDDANGNEVIVTPATTSAVNQVTVTNSATGNAVSIAATGDDTNIDLNLAGKGTGTVNIAGSGAGTLGLADTDASHFLNLTPGSNLTADRTLTVTTGDANRTLTISGDTTLGGGTMTATIASGTAALGTSAITSGSCATVVTVSATGVATTDTITWVFNADPTSTTGYNPSTGVLTIFVYPTANNVNFKVCNTLGSSITPGAVTINWRVTR